MSLDGIETSEGVRTEPRNQTRGKRGRPPTEGLPETSALAEEVMELVQRRKKTAEIWGKTRHQGLVRKEGPGR